MDPPQAAEVKTKSEKSEKAKSYDCGLCDTEVVYKIAQELLPGLASSCVDNTTGGIFTTAGTIANDMRNEMTDYLTKRSETYVAEYLLAENASMLELSEHPYDIILNLIDDFASSKTNMLSRVSEWVLSDRREDKIDDFVQEMEINGFWLLARREYVASMLLKNVDYKNAFHCNMVCSSEEEVVKHRSECMFRPMDCTNEGCTTRYCAAQKEHHEAVCPFMVLPCEQNCSYLVMRREMDRHCVTICPLKLVNCAFYTVGCISTIPRCNVQQHNVDELSSHLLYIIRTAHKEASDDDLKHRVEQIRNLLNIERLARARDTRALTYLIKDAEAKLGPLDVSNKKELPTKPEPSAIKDGVDLPKNKEEPQGTQSVNEMMSSTEKPAITKDDSKLPTQTEPSVVKDGVDLPKNKEEPQGTQSATEMASSTEKPAIKKDDSKLPTQTEPSVVKDTKLPTQTDPPVVKDNVDLPKNKEGPKGTQPATEMAPSTEKPVIAEDDTKLPTKSEPSVVKDGVEPPKKNEENQGPQLAINTRQSTEKPVITKDDTKLSTKEAGPESSSAVPPVKLEGNKDKSSSPLEDSKELSVKEHTASSPKGEKAKDESSNTVIEKPKTEEENTKKSSDDGKIKQVASNDEEDTKKSHGKESVKGSPKEDAKDSSHQKVQTHDASSDDDESMNTPFMVTPFDSDDDESMKSPLESDTKSP